MFRYDILILPEFDYLGERVLSMPGPDCRYNETVAIWENSETHKLHITTPQKDNGVVWTVMPRDMPSSGVYYFRPTSSNMCDYTSGYTKSYINRLARIAGGERDEY